MPSMLVAKRVKENNLKWLDDDGSVLAGVILGLYNSSEPNKANDRKINDGRVTDKRTFVCPKCDRGWEFVIHSTGSSYASCILYSKNIVKYKKQRKICRNCKGDTTIEK
tara:strand:- start:310 stop:636 length:327 start_codon:yes stop_codon:yes gene_type:complete